MHVQRCMGCLGFYYWAILFYLLTDLRHQEEVVCGGLVHFYAYFHIMLYLSIDVAVHFAKVTRHCRCGRAGLSLCTKSYNCMLVVISDS